MLVIFIYLGALIFAGLLSLPMIRKIKTLIEPIIKGDVTTETFQQKLSERINKKVDSFPSGSELAGTEVLGTKLLSPVKFLVFIHTLPPFLIGLLTIANFGPRLLWRLPFDRYLAWDWLFLFTSSYYIQNNSPRIGLAISAWIVVVEASYIFGVDISPKYDQPHKFGLTRVLFNGLTVLFAFGLVYWAVSKINLMAFDPGAISLFDAVTLSFSTASLANFSTPIPKMELVKVILICESIFVFCYVAIFLSVYVPNWHQAKKELFANETK